MQLVKSPYLALVPTQTSESIYIDVARNKTGPLNRFLGTWLEELTSPRPYQECIRQLEALGVAEAEALLSRLRDNHLLVNAEQAYADGFTEDFLLVGYGINLFQDCPLASLTLLQSAAFVLTLDTGSRLEQLRLLNPNVETLDPLFDRADRNEALALIAQVAIDRLSQHPGGIFAFYGNPVMGSAPTQLFCQLAAQQGKTVRVFAAASFVERVVADLQVDPFNGFCLLRPGQMALVNPALPTLVGGFGYNQNDEQKQAELDTFLSALHKVYPPEYQLIICRGGSRGQSYDRVRLDQFIEKMDHGHSGSLSVFLPRLKR